MPLPICTVKWAHSGRYNFSQRVSGYNRNGADYVNKQYAGLCRNVSIPFEYICITDDPSGLHPDIKTVPIWEELKGSNRNWRKLKLFSRDMKDLIGPRFAYLDMDLVITDSIDHLLSRQETFTGVSLRKKAPGGDRGDLFHTGFFVMDSGIFHPVWEEFPGVPAARARVKPLAGSDQAWFNRCIWENIITPEGTGLSSEDGVYLYRDIKRKKRKPDNACLIMFAGKFDPRAKRVRREAPWVMEHWRAG